MAEPAAAAPLPASVSGSSSLDFITHVSTRIESAALLLGTAFVEAGVRDFRPRRLRRIQIHDARGRFFWYSGLVEDCLARSREVRNALVHAWVPTPHAERLAGEAFSLLCELTPARTELQTLCSIDRARAFAALAGHLDAVILQVERSATLLGEVSAAAMEDDDRAFAEIHDDLLRKANGGVSLTEAAALVGVTRQALHKQIKAGTVLGMMDGPRLVLPRAQFVPHEDRHTPAPGLGEVLKLFAVAGPWAALQFLVEPDPNLADTPLRALVAGRTEAVLSAARAYLGEDED